MPPAYRIEYDPEADQDLDYHRGSGAAGVRQAVEDQLRHEPLKETRNRKPVRGVEGVWELRVPPFRVYYEVDLGQRTVYVFAVAYKPRETAYRRGKEFRVNE